MSFASCKKTEQNPDASQITTTTETTTFVELDSEINPDGTENTVVGTWVYEETISAKTFYGDYYNEKITKNNVQMRTTYNFNKDGSYSTSVTIINIPDVRKEYRSLMVEGARRNVEKEGKFLTTDDVLYYEKYADDILKNICKTTKGTYKIDGDKLKYSDGTTEKFAINGKNLTLKGSTKQNGEYQIVLTRK
jgi:hypothetical protein